MGLKWPWCHILNMIPLVQSRDPLTQNVANQTSGQTDSNLRCKPAAGEVQANPSRKEGVRQMETNKTETKFEPAPRPPSPPPVPVNRQKLSRKTVDADLSNVLSVSVGAASSVCEQMPHHMRTVWESERQADISRRASVRAGTRLFCGSRQS